MSSLIKISDSLKAVSPFSYIFSNINSELLSELSVFMIILLILFAFFNVIYPLFISLLDDSSKQMPVLLKLVKKVVLLLQFLLKWKLLFLWCSFIKCLLLLLLIILFFLIRCKLFFLFIEIWSFFSRSWLLILIWSPFNKWIFTYLQLNKLSYDIFFPLLIFLWLFFLSKSTFSFSSIFFFI